LAELLQRYVQAMHAHLVYRKGIPREVAKDLVQGFIADRVLDADFLSLVDRSRGKFRTFLATSLDHYLIDRYRFESAKKRSPSQAVLVALDEQNDSVGSSGQGVDPFDLEWATQVIHGALDRMRCACEANDKAHIWKVFKARIAEPMLHGTPPMPYDQVITQFGFKSYAHATKALHSTKAVYLEHLKAVVADYAGCSDQVDQEIDDLRRILSNS
jgi:hypothetical protein